MRVSSICICE